MIKKPDDTLPHWSTRAAKHLEKPRTISRKRSQQEIAEMIEKYPLFLQQERRVIVKDLALGTVILAYESQDPRWIRAQHTLEEMWKNTGSLLPAPKLFIHMQQSTIRKFVEKLNISAVVNDDHIHLIHSDLQKDGNESPVVRALLAHEISHIVNDGPLTESLSDRNREGIEILANKRGAILYGNPRAYAKAISQIYWDKCASPYESMDDAHMSPNRVARLLSKWAKILEREGAADPETGNITDIKKATEIYDRSKDLTTALAKLDSDIIHQSGR